MPQSTISFETCLPIPEHARLVMEWRNDPATLSASYHHEPKVWDSFWPEYQTTYFQHHPHPIFIINEGVRVGFIRFTTEPHPQGLPGQTLGISINLSPAQRGKGLGTAALASVQTYARELGIQSLYAEVRETNEASHRSFSTAGFQSIGLSTKHVSDTGETCQIHRFITNLTPAFWRQHPVYIIAEAGSNWRAGTPARDLAMAKALIDVAAQAGADAVKFQTYRPETVYAENSGESDYLADNGIKQSIRDIFADLAMPYEMVKELAEYCSQKKIDFMSTGFSPADFAAIDPYVTIHKIASYEISHTHLLTLAAQSNKPLILSTGASAEEDIAWAVQTYREAGGRDLCLMQCTAKYPAPISSLNLGVLPWLQNRFGVATGLSDHSREPSLAPIVAVALGAHVIEKHYTLDNRLPGPDHSFAILPHELQELVRQVRMAEQSLGHGQKIVLPEEKELASFARRGLQATRPIQAGERLKEGENYAILRPGKNKLGVHPRHAQQIENHAAARALAIGEGIQLDDVRPL